MSRAFRVLVIWTVAAVVPLKGLAAATMLGCGPGHEGAGVAGLAQAAVGGHGAPGSHPVEPAAGRTAHAPSADAGIAQPATQVQTQMDARAAAPAHAQAPGHGHPDDHDGVGSIEAKAAQIDPASPSADSTTPAHGLALKCSSCSPCCAAAAPAPQAIEVSAGAPVSALAAFSDERYAGIVVDVPHRPPRLILA